MLSPKMLCNLIHTLVASTLALRASSNGTKMTMEVQVDGVSVSDEVRRTLEAFVACGKVASVAMDWCGWCWC